MDSVGDPPAPKKAKLSPIADYEDDAFAQLEKMDPLPTSQSQPLGNSSASDQLSSANVHLSMNSGQSIGAGSLSISSSSGNHIGFSGHGSQTVSSCPTLAHCTSVTQQNQPSVLQELLLNPSHASVQSMSNSPRSSYSTTYQTRSPLTSVASVMSTSNCPQNIASGATVASRLRTPGPQMFAQAGHQDMSPMQQAQMTHNQQSNYQLISHGNQPALQSHQYGYQQQATPGTRSVYGGNLRGGIMQSVGMGRGNGPIINGNGNHAPRVRATLGATAKVAGCRQMNVPGYQNMMPMQANGSGQMMRNIVHSSQFDQSTYVMPIAGGNPPRPQDPYGISQSQQGQQQSMPSSSYVHLPPGHMGPRSQGPSFSSQPGLQSQGNFPSHLVDHQILSQQASSSQVLNNMQSIPSHSLNGPPSSLSSASSATVVNTTRPNSQLQCTQSHIPVSNSAANAVPLQFNAQHLQRDSGSNSSMPSGQDPEKRKLIQQQLVLLLHAHKCQQRERNGDANGRTACNLPHCSTMKEVLSHMVGCNNGRSCSFPHCASSRQIISHWKNCTREDCPVCKPLKSIQNTSPGLDRRSAGEIYVSAQIPPAQSLASTASRAATDAGVSLQPVSNLMNPNYGSPIVPTTTSLLVDYNPSSSECDPFRSSNPPNKVLNSRNVGGDAIRSLPPPDAPAVGKEWHSTVTMDLRNHLVGKLVRAIFPSPDPNALADQRLRDLICYARKVEKDMFEAANDREEYYHLLAEKIYKIQKELQEKKYRRMNDQNMLSNASTNLPVLDVDCVPPPNRTADQANVSAVPGQMGSSAIFADNSPNIIPKVEPMEGIESSTSTHARIDEISSGRSSKSMPSSAIQSTIVPSQRVKAESSSSAQADSLEADVKDREHVCDPNELRILVKPILEKLQKMDESIPFRIPVDPIILAIPDYFEIVKNPIDLQTIEIKLDQGEYNNALEFCRDMWLMFENAWTYNRKNSKVYKYSTKLSEAFTEEIDPVMHKMGYCCGNKLSFTPLALFCYGQSMCTIARDQAYMVYENSTSKFNVVVNERYTYCLKCFEALPESGISMSDNPNDTSNMVPKSKFKLMKNDQIDHEPMEKCKLCYRNIHRICVIHHKSVYSEEFICSTCRKQKCLPPLENRFTAKKLPHSNLSRYVEDRVNNYLRKTTIGKDCEVIIRVLCATDKEVEVKSAMKAKYCQLGFPEKFPYRSKAIFAFEVIDGVEVCFFGLHVQEYGSNCAAPNQRRVYIAYLDSVNFFQPRALRTEVYHELLLGYLQYVNMLGYTMAHIWACPPSEGDDYIFHCHPPEMKIPKPKRLQDWYKKMLEKGITENIVYSYKDIYHQAKDDNLNTPMAMPYFEGDFWPNVLEDCIRDVEKEEQERKRQEELNQNGDEDDDHDASSGLDGGKSSKKNSKRKNNLKKNAKSKKKVCSITGDEVTDKLYSSFDKHKEVFFTIRLMSPQSELSAQHKEIKDPDGIYACDLMDGRDTFLTRARDEHWEFSSLRRAKYSTLCFCQALHTQDRSQGLSYTCNKCQRAAHWHCSTCEDFDLCDQCHQMARHEHRLEKVNVLVEVNEDRSNSTAGRLESIQRCISSLVHACQCRDANCRRASCKNMKRVVMHARQCKKRSSASCAICKQLIALCCYHAKHCDSNDCNVPFCANIRKKLQDQKRSVSRRADMLMRRRMDMLHAGNNTAGSSTASNQGQSFVIGKKPSGGHGNTMQFQAQDSNMGQLGGSLQTIPGTTNQTMIPHINQPHHHISQMSPMHTQQYLSHGKGQGSNAQQGSATMMNVQSIHHAHGKGPGQMQPGLQSNQPNVRMHMTSQFSGLQRGSTQNPQRVAQTMNPPPYVRPGAQQGGYVMSASASSGYVGTGQSMIMNHNPMQQGQQVQQMMHQQGVRSKMFTGPVMEPSRSTANTSQSLEQQLPIVMERLKNARTPEEKEQIFSDLKKMPHLFAAFIKMKKSSAEINQGQGGHSVGQPQMVSGTQNLQGISQPISMQQQQQHNMMRQSHIVGQQGGQWQQQSSMSPQTPQFYQQQSNGAQSGQSQQQRGAPQYTGLITQSQVGNTTGKPQWQSQFQRNSQPLSPAVQQFNQVNSPNMNRPPSVSGMAPSPMVHPTGNSMQQMPPQVHQEQQNYR